MCRIAASTSLGLLWLTISALPAFAQIAGGGGGGGGVFGGGGGFGFGFGGSITDNVHGSLGTSELIIVPSNSGHTVFGYSVETGKWDQLRVPATKKEEIDPTVSQGVGCFVLKEKAYGFSARTGKWSVADLPEPQSGAIEIASANLIVVQNGSAALGFNNQIGKWAVVKLDHPAAPALSHSYARIDDGSKIYVFSANAEQWEMVDLAAD